MEVMEMMVKLSEKQRKWLIDTAMNMDKAINELFCFLKENNGRKDRDFYEKLGVVMRKAETAIFKHLSAKHKIAKTYYTDKFTKDFRLLKHTIVLRIAQEIHEEWVENVLSDWILDDEELEWVLK